MACCHYGGAELCSDVGSRDAPPVLARLVCIQWGQRFGEGGAMGQHAMHGSEDKAPDVGARLPYANILPLTPFFLLVNSNPM